MLLGCVSTRIRWNSFVEIAFSSSAPPAFLRHGVVNKRLSFAKGLSYRHWQCYRNHAFETARMMRMLCKSNPM